MLRAGDRRAERERRLFLYAASLEEFTSDDLWRPIHPFFGTVSYQVVLSIMLQWWRDGYTVRWDARNRTWVEGYPWSKVRNRFPGVARYRWRGEGSSPEIQSEAQAQGAETCRTIH